ncbi:protocadherin alpha-7-like isoform X18 [Polypterus senegalus]|uniref:protocadherin alpha-7-like isoform X18 n=1 Tax=Polypterus senegalus TaxID=55291 RepID=UPI0019667708|nr:protocadherin alpha-7-like isoform X18 [Polypterus senegalus]
MVTMRGLRGFNQTALFSALVFCFWKYSFAYLRYSVPEESASGTIIGNIIRDLGLDMKNIEGRGFRIISGLKEQLLQVNQKSGVLFVNEIIDREILCDREKPCFLNVKIIVENPLEIHQAEVEVIDLNDNSPAFLDKNKSLEISESTPVGSRFTLEEAVDPDFGVNSLKSYQLSQNDHFILQVKEGSKRNKIPVLVLQKTLDRELKAKYNLLLTAFDGGNPPRSANMNITVQVGDVNDNAPVFTEEIYSVTLEENVPVGTLVVQVKASDLDEGKNGEIFYSFEKSVQNIADELFTLDAYTGEIRVKGVIDFEEKEFYEIEVKATDKGPIPMSSQCTALIKIKDMNDNAPVIEITSLTSSITEDVKPGTVVGLISITDLDSGVNSKIACACSDNLPFELKQSFQENLFSLITNSHLDRESAPQYNITITAKDFGNPSLSSYKTAVVNVLDVNDNNPRFLQNPYVFYIMENNTPGASILSVSAVDEDANENALITYYLRESEAVDKSVVPFLSINSNNGQVFSFTSFDFEELKSFTFMALAKDSGMPSLSSNVTVNVFILDENDNPPVVVFPLTLNGTAVVQETIPRNVKAGYLVTRIRAYDADVGYNAWLSFSLEEATDSSLFSVGRHTGDVRTRRAITESDVTVQKITILVKDSGSVSFSASATVIVTAAENTEAHALSEVKYSPREDEQDNNMTFYLIILLSSVSCLFIFTIIALIAFQCHRAHRNFLHKNYLSDVNYAEVSGSLFHSHQYQTAEKRFVFVEPGMNKDSVVDLGSNANTLVISDDGVKIAQMPKQPNTDWRYSASLRAGMQSSVHMEESAVLQGPSGVHIQNWPTVSSATPEPEAGEVSPPVGAGINSNSWTFKYGPPAGNPQQLKPGEVPENFIIPGSPAIISIRQGPPGAADDKSDFITFGKKEETKKKKKKKKGKADKKEKANDGGDH